MKVKKIVSSLMWGIGFITVGVLMLLNSLGVLQFDLSKWWPLVFVFIGINIILEAIADGISKER
jgi:hypothetical protein